MTETHARNHALLLLRQALANPDADFRFDPSLGTTGGYILNLKTAGLSTGTYALSFVADADPTIHSAYFQVR